MAAHVRATNGPSASCLRATQVAAGMRHSMISRESLAGAITAADGAPLVS